MISSFAPVVPAAPRVLMLGSMPGVRSLHEQQYYAHPQNQFWRLMAVVLDQAAVPPDYAARLAMLSDAGVALWDVLAECTREGSLDSAIRDERANDIGALLSGSPALRVVALNGRKAESSFARHVGYVPGVMVVGLPSSSAANARLTFEAKAALWCEGLRPWLR
ncbi:MAG: DNA-deoxyinosine glycosylase [Pseudomonadota bacterium]